MIISRSSSLRPPIRVNHYLERHEAAIRPNQMYKVKASRLYSIDFIIVQRSSTLENTVCNFGHPNLSFGQLGLWPRLQKSV